MLFSSIFRALICGAAAGVLVACDQGGTVNDRISAAHARNDGPAIWRVTDVDSTLYLYGTVHLLPDDLSWQRDDMREAFDSAGTIFFEVDTRGKAALDATVLTSSLGLYRDGGRLSDRLDNYQLKLLEAATHNGDISLAAIDSMHPWLASEFLAVAAAANAGLSPDISADEALKNRAERLGKNVIFLETIEQQIRLSSEQPEFVQITLLTDTLENFNSMGSDMKRLTQAWVIGQTDFMTREIIMAAKSRSIDLYQSLFSDRNTEWADQLTEFLEGNGTGFAAIGIGHLLGEDSIQDRLREKGYEVSRYYAFQGDPVIRPAFDR